MLATAACSSLAPGRSWTAVVGATDEEVAALRAELGKVARFDATQQALGIPFTPFRIGGKRGVLFGSGMSMVNAAYAMQFAFDRYPISTVLVGGTAGGVNPELLPGDVVVPERWHHHSEAVYLNERADGEGFILRDGFVPPYENFGFVFPRPVQVMRAGMAEPVDHAFFEADSALVRLARNLTPVLPVGAQARRAVVRVGGAGGSGPVFLDNRRYREWMYSVWESQVVDMESTAIAQVSWANEIPFVIVRAVSDLAGGQDGPNESDVHGGVAAVNAAVAVVGILQAHVSGDVAEHRP
jgi:adenosylhomocysteine nucleosidase